MEVEISGCSSKVYCPWDNFHEFHSPTVGVSVAEGEAGQQQDYHVGAQVGATQLGAASATNHTEKQECGRYYSFFLNFGDVFWYF